MTMARCFATLMLAITSMAGWMQAANAEEPKRLFFAFGCFSLPCRDYFEVLPGTPAFHQRSIKRPEYINDASIRIMLSDGNAKATVQWHTVGADGRSTKGGQTFEIRNIPAGEWRLFQVPTGTRGEHDLFLLTAATPPGDFRDIRGFGAPDPGEVVQHAQRARPAIELWISLVE